MTKSEFDQVYETDILTEQNEIATRLRRKTDGQIIFIIRIPLPHITIEDIKLYTEMNKEDIIEELKRISLNMIYSIYNVTD